MKDTIETKSYTVEEIADRMKNDEIEVTVEEKKDWRTKIVENKGKIIKRALIVIGGAAGLILAGKLLSKKNDEEDEETEYVCEDYEEIEDSEDDTDSSDDTSEETNQE